MDTTDKSSNDSVSFSEISIETPAETPAETPTIAPNNAPNEAPKSAEILTESPTVALTEIPYDNNAPTETTTRVPPTAPTGVLTKAPIEAPIRASAEAPIEAPIRAPAEAPNEQIKTSISMDHLDFLANEALFEAPNEKADQLCQKNIRNKNLDFFFTKY